MVIGSVFTGIHGKTSVAFHSKISLLLLDSLISLEINSSNRKFI